MTQSFLKRLFGLATYVLGAVIGLAASWPLWFGVSSVLDQVWRWLTRLKQPDIFPVVVSIVLGIVIAIIYFRKIFPWLGQFQTLQISSENRKPDLRGHIVSFAATFVMTLGTMALAGYLLLSAYVFGTLFLLSRLGGLNMR